LIRRIKSTPVGCFPRKSGCKPAVAESETPPPAPQSPHSLALPVQGHHYRLTISPQFVTLRVARKGPRKRGGRGMVKGRGRRGDHLSELSRGSAVAHPPPPQTSPTRLQDQPAKNRSPTCTWVQVKPRSDDSRRTTRRRKTAPLARRGSLAGRSETTSWSPN
jgi:hypothetical protein